jgi:hypothetical protein
MHTQNPESERLAQKQAETQQQLSALLAVARDARESQPM